MTDRSHITLYSGGHKGTESEFGRLAEEWGIQEVNFSFEGHVVERSRGRCELSPEELDKGNVSMEIVSARMGRKFAQANKIRKVIQTIFHMVNNGYHVIAVGWIQPDDTVKGGNRLGRGVGQAVQPAGACLRSGTQGLVHLERQCLGSRGA